MFTDIFYRFIFRLSFDLTRCFSKSCVTKILSRAKRNTSEISQPIVISSLISVRNFSSCLIARRTRGQRRLKINGGSETLSSNFIDRKTLTWPDTEQFGGATALGRYSSRRQREARNRICCCNESISRSSLIDHARIKRPAAEFNALHVGYFAVSPCTVKVHAGAHACACTHTFGESVRQVVSLHSPHASRLVLLLRIVPSFVCVRG